MKLCRPFSVALFSSAVAAWLAGCALPASSAGEAASDSVEAALTTSEGFESGSKTAYAAANVSLSSGSWNLNDALIGSLASDVKAGTSAARIRNSGTLTMNFDRTGAGVVTVKHATFGSDAAGTWGLFASQTQGSAAPRKT